MALSPHFGKRLADEQARNPVGASDLNAALGFQVANDVLNKFPLSLPNIRVELAKFTVNCPNFARPKNFGKHRMHVEEASTILPNRKTPQTLLTDANSGRREVAQS